MVSTSPKCIRSSLTNAPSCLRVIRKLLVLGMLIIVLLCVRRICKLVNRLMARKLVRRMLLTLMILSMLLKITLKVRLGLRISIKSSVMNANRKLLCVRIVRLNGLCIRSRKLRVTVSIPKNNVRKFRLTCRLVR